MTKRRCPHNGPFLLFAVALALLTTLASLSAESVGQNIGSAVKIAADEAGTVKAGDYSQLWTPSWKIQSERRFVVDPVLLIILGIILFCLIALIAVIRGIIAALAEGLSIRAAVHALITGDIMPREQKKRMRRLRRRGIGLRIKLASFTIALVLLVVVMIAAPLYIRMTRTQRETLLQGLWDRSTVLLEGLSTNVRAYLPRADTSGASDRWSADLRSEELAALPAQITAIPEARYVTITAYNPETPIFDDEVWASNDPALRSKIDTAELQPGISRLTDILTPRLENIAWELNSRAHAEVDDLSAAIADLTREARDLASRTESVSINQQRDLQASIRFLETRISERLFAISREIGSEPVYRIDEPVSIISGIARLLPILTGRNDDDENLTYIFFKPVMYREGTEAVYFRGLIRLEVSIDSILHEIEQGQREILETILLVAGIVMLIGSIGAFIFSTLIILPIKRLVSHVELIRDMEDKSKLDGVDITINSRDELAVLGNTINDMTHGLVKAAQASEDLTIGKEVQKKFIPLETDKDGNKLTFGFKNTPNARFFGYYEGAKGVSGDYFDYLDLDGRYFAIIKCDVAGKGIPAALIMIQVATMFLNYFKDWKPTPSGMHIEEVVYQINDFIETLGFEGRFAAFTLCLFDSQTGLLRFCNAGDNIVHWYDASEGRMKLMTLRQSPATGVLPNSLVESKGGYMVQTVTIDPGDILFLYTDGIEEAKRKFRDTSFNEILCTGEPDANEPADSGVSANGPQVREKFPKGAPHENHVVGQGDEELGAGRVEAIINAVMNRQVYSLTKYHNPEGEITLQFDFTACAGYVEEAIMALVSVEKMFRLYKRPLDGEDARVLVDRKVDEFLQEHFLQYGKYCAQTREYSENNSYLYYTHVMEDPQYDDLTIMGIKRKQQATEEMI
ncbi:hypothetical protein FACS1894124_1100 [Spirochaetia bacterium]|nr:hypothetical protein FACS1894124_1100 [Spirochaetia bacterium]